MLALVVLAKAMLATSAHGQCSQELAVELLFDLQILRLQHAYTLLLVSLVEFFVHSFFLDELPANIQPFASALVMQLRRPLGRLQSGIQAPVFATRGCDKGTKFLLALDILSFSR